MWFAQCAEGCGLNRFVYKPQCTKRKEWNNSHIKKFSELWCQTMRNIQNILFYTWSSVYITSILDLLSQWSNIFFYFGLHSFQKLPYTICRTAQERDCSATATEYLFSHKSFELYGGRIKLLLNHSFNMEVIFALSLISRGYDEFFISLKWPQAQGILCDIRQRGKRSKVMESISDSLHLLEEIVIIVLFNQK